MGVEKSAEIRLIAAIRGLNMVAWHMDCSVDGFPDILALGNKVSFVVEVKQGPVSTKLSSAFETSQPVWAYHASKVEYENVFQVLYHEGMFCLYKIDNLWKRVENGERFCDIEPLLVSVKAAVIAKEIKRRAHESA